MLMSATTFFEFQKSIVDFLIISVFIVSLRSLNIQE